MYLVDDLIKHTEYVILYINFIITPIHFKAQI